jgi:thioredoxin-like negative regulator of GroEL
MTEVYKEDDLTKALRLDERICALFYASWCPFCKSFLPIFDKEVQMNHSDKFLRVRIDDEANPIWGKYDIEVVPTVIFFKAERVWRRLDGVLGAGLREEQLRSFLHDITKKLL